MTIDVTLEDILYGRRDTDGQYSVIGRAIMRAGCNLQYVRPGCILWYKDGAWRSWTPDITTAIRIEALRQSMKVEPFTFDLPDEGDSVCQDQIYCETGKLE